MILLSILALVVLHPETAWSDEPLPAAETRVVCSLNGFFCALLDPDQKMTTVVRRRAGGINQPLWSMPGWFRVAFLSNDGEYLITGHNGGGVLSVPYRKDEVMVSFYDRGRLTNQVRLNELVRDFPRLGNNVTYYHWGDYLGLNPMDHLTIQLANGNWLMFDVKTGRTIK